MPIRADRRRLYPEARAWREIRAQTLRRAGYRCEGSPRFPACRAEHGNPHPVTGARVVLTCAHLDHNPENNALTNLRQLCQRCHLAHDVEEHAARRRRPPLEPGHPVLPGLLPPDKPR